jgi:hypothetical protein
MFGYFKAQPTEHVIHYSGGKPKREGGGLAFFYLRYNTQIVVIPTSSLESGLVFNEVTRNFQDVTIQGRFTYRIVNPKIAAALLNYTMDPRSREYVSNDPERLPQRLSNVIQMETRNEIQTRSLEQVLTQYEAIAQAVTTRVSEGRLFESSGAELLSLYFVSAKPTPEVGKALEAEYRETLLRKADEAIYARRAAAVAEERKIKENELATEIAIAEQRAQLIALEGENALREAENGGKALEMRGEYELRSKRNEVELYRSLDPRVLLGLAMHEMGENASQIGNLTITSEMLASLLNGRPAE